MMRKLLRSLAVAVSVLLVTLVALEAVVRLSGYAEPHLYDPIYTAFDRSPDIPYVHKPGLVQARARGLAVIDTDGLGLRTVPRPTPRDVSGRRELRIALAGDSVTFGEGVPRTADTYAKVLEDELERRQPAAAVTVYNFGASAYSVREMAATLQHRMPEVRPDLVLMAIIPADFNLGRTPTVDASGYLIDQTMTGILPADTTLRRLIRSVHLLYVARDVGIALFARRPDIARDLARGAIPDSYRYLTKFRDLAERHGYAYAIVLLPRPGGASWAPLTVQLARDRIVHVDLTPLGGEFTADVYKASRYDWHPSPAVHRRIGETLAAHFAADPSLFPRVAAPH